MGWLEDSVARAQSIEDLIKVPDKVASYNKKAADWIKTNSYNQDNGLAITPVPTMPTRIVFYIDPQTGQEQTEEAIPGLVVPTLPTPAGANTTNGFQTHSGEVEQDMFTVLLSIQKDIKTLLAK